MGAVLGFILIILFVVKCASEASKPTMPGGYDIKKLHQGSINVSTGKTSKENYKKGIESGHYHKQK